MAAEPFRPSYSAVLLGCLALPGLPRNGQGGAAAPAPVRRALLVGISHYARPGRNPAWWNLNGRNDVAEIRRVLQECYGFRPENIHVLVDAQATRAGIIRAFRDDLITPSRPGDTAVFEFSGHGQQVKDDNGDEADGMDE